MQIKRLQIDGFIFDVIANSAKYTSLVRRNKMEKLKDFISSGKYKNN